MWIDRSNSCMTGKREVIARFAFAVRLIKPFSKDNTWRYLPFFQHTQLCVIADKRHQSSS